MKASCRACARSYSVSDERIEGHTGRFRCKCGAQVWVDGRTIARANPALWAVEVSTTDRRWLARDVGDPPRSWMSLLGVAAATVAVATTIFLWRTADVDAPAAPAADRPVSLGAGAPRHAPVPPALSASASAPDPSGSAARLRAPAPVERRSR
jgi:hypothetical protein